MDTSNLPTRPDSEDNGANACPSDAVSVLVAEDHVATRYMMTTLLQRHGYHVRAVGDGFEAEGVLAMPDGPTIALMDWGLPHQSGLEVCRALRRRPHQRYVYTIIVTARDSMEDLAEALAAGADDYIRKPYDPVEVLARVRSGQRIVDLEHRLTARISECELALDNIRKLKALLPICMYCKKVRDDSQYWQEIEHYIHAHTGTDFSHGICPDCMTDVRASLTPDEARRNRIIL